MGSPISPTVDSDVSQRRRWPREDGGNGKLVTRVDFAHRSWPPVWAGNYLLWGAVAVGPACPYCRPRGSLAGMLGHLPDLPVQDGTMVTYADVAGQVGALGIAPVHATDSVERQQAWVSALSHLYLPTTSEHWGRPEWRQAFGFDVYQIAQAVEYAPAPPFLLTALHGDFDPAELRAAWARGGYQPIDLGAGAAYAVRPDFAIDLDDPNSRMAMSYLNVMALADDGTLIFGNTRDAVRGALAAASGQGPSLAERPDVAPLVNAAPPDLLSALIVPGTMLQTAPDVAAIVLGDESPEAFATRAAAEEREARRLPPVAAVVLGFTAGAFPDGSEPTPAAEPAPVAGRPGQVVVILAMVGARAAAEGAAVIENRLATGRLPSLMGGDLADRLWAELYPERSVQVIAEEPAVLIALMPAPGVSPNLLQSLLFGRAPTFLSWQW